MLVRQFVHSQGPLPPSADLAKELGPACAVLLVFAAVSRCEREDLVSWLRGACPQALIIGCSTAGEVTGTGLHEGTVVVTGIAFKRTQASVITVDLASAEDSFNAGCQLAERAAALNPRALFLLAQGTNINAAALLKGLHQKLDAQVAVSGGLAGDNGRFHQTYLLTQEGQRRQGVVALMLSDGIQLNHGSQGGWRVFGPRRRITRAEGNVLFELDAQPALALYKRYLGDHAWGLPASGLLFPFAMWRAGEQAPRLIRTILGVDEERGALIMAGDLSEAESLQLMHASTDALIEGAQAAAKEAERGAQAASIKSHQLALLISCVGRKLVMGGRTDDEIDAVRDVLGHDVPLCGFYSYGEIAPNPLGQASELNNQTMTVTTWSEP